MNSLQDNPTRRSLTMPQTVALLAIVLVAAFLRGHDLLQIEHNVDHAYPVWQALNTLEHGIFPLAGQGTSVLFANPALTGYVFLPLVALTRSPLGAYILVIALNTLAVLLAFRAARSMLGARVALIAAVLLAVNPWVIEYSRTSWVQSLLPFFACALAWLLWPVLLGRSKRPTRRLILALIVLTLYTQTYLLAFLSLAPVALLGLLFWRLLPRRALLAGGGFFIIVTLIYGAGLLAQADNVGERVNEFSDSPRQLSAEAWTHAVRLVSGEDYEVARGVDAPTHDSALRHDLTPIAHIAVYVALLLGVALALVSIVRRYPGRQRELAADTGDLAGRPYTKASIILLLWFGLPVVLMSYVGQPVHPFYQLIGLPAGHILAAWGLTTIFPARYRWTNGVLMVLLVPFALLMGINSSRYYQETAAHPGAENLSALSLEYGLQLGRAIDEHLPSDGVVFADTDEWILNSFAGHSFSVIRDVRLPDVQLIPSDGALVVQMQATGIAAVTYANRVENLSLPDGWMITVDQYTADTLPQIEQSDQVESQEGITFLGHNLEREGESIQLTTFWRVDSLQTDTGETLFAPFVHVFDSNGNRVGIVDGDVIAGFEWHVGDIHVHRMHFDLPDSGAPFSLRVGQYDSVHDQNVIFLPDFTPTIDIAADLQN